MRQRGSYAKGLAKRDEILDAALQSFIEKGYDRTSVREIARMVELSQAGLLHHFSNKEQLFLEVLRRRDEQSISGAADRGVHSVQGLIDAIARNVDQEGLVGLYVVMSAESAHTEGLAREFLEGRYEWVIDDISQDVARMQEEGEMTLTVGAHEIASLLVAAADGLQIQWLLNRRSVDMVEQMHTLVNAFRL
ncbi:TetR/AcrR family transcriptional regulator [Demequina zhanjiangensis]|uniref:Helix-turn-helix domain-containing protein n=1 Tax=Demequina zhanjiangensis TaxID=3051659 RepID=A0ABT8G3W6_9MICO|nr:TetR/AcrR family transcriptional regulator [Demequina sp. SYSU T00b26]MDN4473820.1 helix-turn-helix domain-containing protein [Demequina sp. SYSU T00b26]